MVPLVERDLPLLDYAELIHNNGIEKTFACPVVEYDDNVNGEPTSVIIDDESSSSMDSVSTYERRNPRTVSFSNDVSVHEILSLNEYSCRELSATWYDGHDMIRMKKEARRDGKLLQTGVLVEDETSWQCSIRGLESRTAEGLNRKKRNRFDAYAAIFMVIDTQDVEGYCDDDAIADAYRVHSERCLGDAQIIAQRDEVDVRNMWATDNELSQ
jgi:hypothetical protein